MSRNRKINWLKVGANTGVAFFSVLGSTLTVDTLSGHKIPLDLLVIAAVMCAVMQAGLTMCRELAKAADRCEPPEDGTSREVITRTSRHEGGERTDTESTTTTSRHPDGAGRSHCGKVQTALNLLTLF